MHFQSLRTKVRTRVSRGATDALSITTLPGRRQRTLSDQRDAKVHSHGIWRHACCEGRRSKPQLTSAHSFSCRTQPLARTRPSGRWLRSPISTRARSSTPRPEWRCRCRGWTLTQQPGSHPSKSKTSASTARRARATSTASGTRTRRWRSSDSGRSSGMARERR